MSDPVREALEHGARLTNVHALFAREASDALALYNAREEAVRALVEDYELHIPATHSWWSDDPCLKCAMEQTLARVKEVWQLSTPPPVDSG